jgi:hypothetical protein
MTYQRAPSGVGNRAPVAEPLTQPRSLVQAVYLMRAGAGLAIVGAIVTAAAWSSVHSGVLKALIRDNSNAARQLKPGYTLPQLHQWATGIVLALIVGELLIALLWLWMARANGNGMYWARIASSVFFALLTIQVFRSVSWTSVSFYFLVLEWLIGVVALEQLWRREVSRYMGPG